MRKPWTRWDSLEEVEACKLYREGKTIREIAEWIGRPVASVHAVLHRNGVPMRPRGTPSEDSLQGA